MINSTLFYITAPEDTNNDWRDISKSFDKVFEASQEIISADELKYRKYPDKFQFEVYADDLANGHVEVLISIFKLFSAKHGMKFEISPSFT